MIREASDESVIGEALREAFLSIPDFVVHAWHPPSSKAYFGPIVRIPKRNSSGRERYHIDGLVQLERYLLLVELKGRSSALTSDVEKLAELMGTYTLAEIKSLLQPRIRDKEKLDVLTEWVASFGYLVHDASAPSSGLTFTLGKSGEIMMAIGDGLPDRLAQQLRGFFPTAPLR